VSLNGSANNIALRPILDEECVPQAFASSLLPRFGAPAVFPWVIGNIITGTTEAGIMCDYIVEEFGEGTTTALLYINTETGQGHLNGVEACAEEGKIDLVEAVAHEPTAADITNEMTTLAASGADVFIMGTLGAFCSQAFAAVGASPWDPQVISTSNCDSIPAYFKPVDPAADGVRILSVYTTCADDASDPRRELGAKILTDAGFDACNNTYRTGITFAMDMEWALREALDTYGGITRTNLLRAMWNMDFANPMRRIGVESHSDGVNDAYLVEGAYINQYHAPAAGEELGHYETITDLVSVEGKTGSNPTGE